MTCFDLHSHSTASDGSLSPTALVERAASVGVDVLALTDHDSTAGLSEASRTAQRMGLHLVAGAELSVTWNGQVIHIVGLGIDPAYAPLQQGLAAALAFRHWRADEIGRRLGKAGIEGATEGARKLATGGLVSRTHFAHFLVDHGYAKDIRQVFKRFLTRGRPGHVPGNWATLGDAVGWITGAGGVAVIAHPARYGLTRKRLLDLIAEFVDAGGEALEVVSGSHGADDIRRMADIARQQALLASVGSDYHGPHQTYLELGRMPPLPPGLSPVWESAALQGLVH